MVKIANKVIVHLTKIPELMFFANELANTYGYLFSLLILNIYISHFSLIVIPINKFYLDLNECVAYFRGMCVQDRHVHPGSAVVRWVQLQVHM